jgi:hypothetical protein
MTPALEYRLIPLTQGQFAKVSPHRFEDLSRFKWQAMWIPRSRSFYAVRSIWDGKRNYQILLHRSILGLGFGDKREGDHIDHDTLNDTDDNLRIATRAQQCHNQRKRTSNTSGYTGVYWVARRNCWHAQIKVNGHNKFLGRRTTAEAAYYELYIPAALKHHGEFACLG